MSIRLRRSDYTPAFIREPKKKIIKPITAPIIRKVKSHSHSFVPNPIFIIKLE